MSGTEPISTRRIWIARAIALLADGVQIAIFPMFLEGMLSPANAVLDGIVAIALILLVGWHIAFLPAFIVESLPFADLCRREPWRCLWRRGGRDRVLQQRNCGCR